MYDSNGCEASSTFSVDINAAVLFQDNACGGNGGATGLVGGIVLRFPSNVTFRGNTEGGGGARCLYRVCLLEYNWNKAKFIPNSALIGGGLYSTGSGTAVTGDV